MLTVSHRLLIRGVTNIKTKELLFGIQLEREKGGDMYTGKYSGFNFLDEGMLVLTSVFISQKMAEYDQINNCFKRDQSLSTTHTYLSEMLANKTVTELILYVRESFSNYLGYEFAGLLFSSNNELCTCFLTHYIAGSKAILRFPSDLGISGNAFTSNRIIVMNGENLEKTFHDLDNVGAYVAIQSYAMIPLYGSQGKNGILQLYNKKDSIINKEDIKEFKRLQNTIGGILEYVLELNNALDYLLQARIITSKLMKDVVSQTTSEEAVI